MKHTLLISSFVALTLSTTAFAQEPSSETAPTETTQEAPTTSEAPQVPAVAPTPAQEWPRSLWGVYGGFGAPHVLNGGVEYLDQSRTWSMALDFGAFGYRPKDELNDKEEVALGSVAIEGRYHPFTSSFYIAGALGSQGVTAKKTAVYSGETATAEIRVGNTFATPKVGWFWQFNSGLNFGVEVGAQIPLSTKVEVDDSNLNAIVLNDPEYIKNKKDVTDLAEKLGKQVLPHAVIRLGYAF